MDDYNVRQLVNENSRAINNIRCNTINDKTSLAQLMDVSYPTRASSVKQLVSEGILKEDGNKLQINGEFGYFVGISVGSAQIKFCIVDYSFRRTSYDLFNDVVSDIETLKEYINFTKKKNGSVSNYLYMNTPDNFEELQEKLDVLMDAIILINESRKLRILGIGFAFTGAVNHLTKEVVKSHNLEYLVQKPIKKILFLNRINYFDEQGIVISVDNNSNAAAIAEKYDLYKQDNFYKKYSDKENVITLYLGAGLGAGILLNNRIYRGTSNFSGEIGHTNVPPSSKLENRDCNIDKCTCGNESCFDYRLRHDVFEKTKEEFSKLNSKEIEQYINNEKNEVKRQILGEYLGYIINIVVNILNPDLIIFSGKFKFAITELWKYISLETNKIKLDYINNDCDMIQTRMGAISPAIGAAIVAYHEKYGIEIYWD